MKRFVKLNVFLFHLKCLLSSSVAWNTKNLTVGIISFPTIFLFISALTLIYIAYNPEFAIAAYPVIGINLLGSLLFIFLGLGRHRALLRMPGAFLMGITALLAWLGI